MLAPQCWRNLHLVILFSETKGKIVNLKRALTIRKTCKSIFFQKNIQLQFALFRVLLNKRFRQPLKRMFGAWEMCKNILENVQQPCLNLAIICINLFACNNLIFKISVSFLNKILFLHSTFYFRQTIPNRI